jgi:hypothetical protein
MGNVICARTTPTSHRWHDTTSGAPLDPTHLWRMGDVIGVTPSN